MRHVSIGIAVAVAGVALCWTMPLPAQQATVSTPFNTSSNRFFEQFGVQWGFRTPGFTFNFGGPNFAQPPFGGFQPNAGARGGFGILGNNAEAFFNFSASQGASRGISSQVPSLTLMNGQTGYFSDTSQTPFVISFVPVVGGFPGIGVLRPAPLPSLPVDPLASTADASHANRIQQLRRMLQEQERAEAERDLPAPPTAQAPLLPGNNVPLPPRARPAVDNRAAAVEVTPSEPVAALDESSAGLAVPSVAEARRMHELERGAANRDAQALYDKARAAEDEGKANVAKIYYEMVARRANGELKQQALDKLQSLRSAGRP